MIELSFRVEAKTALDCCWKGARQLQADDMTVTCLRAGPMNVSNDPSTWDAISVERLGDGKWRFSCRWGKPSDERE